MKKLVLKFALLFIVGISVSCSKDELPALEAAFSNLSDNTTTELKTTIPRVELTQQGNELSILLSVTDQDGTPLENFTIGNYKIETMVNSSTEEVNKRNITLTELDKFSNNKPLAVAATLDYSGSMSSRDIRDMELALKSFISLKESTDKMSLFKFGSRVSQVQDFTTDASLLNKMIDQNHYVGASTAFYSACSLGLDKLNVLNDGSLPLVVGFTDGYDNASNISLQNLITKSQAVSIPIYTIGFGGANKTYLQKLADDTGGRFYYAPSGNDIADLYKVINNQLKKLYLFTWKVNYSSGTEVIIKITTEYEAGQGKFKHIAVKKIIVN